MKQIRRLGVLTNLNVLRWLLLFGGFQLNTVHATSGVHFIKTLDALSSAVTCAIVSASDNTTISSPTRSRTECAVRCTRSAGCVGFNYWSTSQICNVFARNPTAFLEHKGCSFYQTGSTSVGSFKTSVQPSSKTTSSSRLTAHFETTTITTSNTTKPSSLSTAPIAALSSTTKISTQYQSNSTLSATTATSYRSYEQIAAHNCSFPFTYNGSIYYNCIPNVTNVTNITRCNQVACLLTNRTWAICISPANFSVATASPIYITIPNMNSTQVMTINNWIMIQQKLLTDTNVSFNRNWTDYRNGFGWFAGNYWLGNENVYQLTNNANYKLRIEVRSTSNGQWTSAEYSSFYIDNEAASYKLHLAGYVGDGGDSMQYTGSLGLYNQNNMMFSTNDRDNDKMLGANCASSHGGGGWWYNWCIWALLNTDDTLQFYWQSLGDPAWYLSASRMMIKLI